jgi:hypothetical protein
MRHSYVAQQIYSKELAAKVVYNRIKKERKVQLKQVLNSVITVSHQRSSTHYAAP